MKYTVDSQQVAFGATTARTTAKNIQSEVATMMGHLLNVRSSWTGSASNAFDDLITRWRGVQAQVDQSLEDISKALELAALQYSDTEAAAARLFM